MQQMILNSAFVAALLAVWVGDGHNRSRAQDSGAERGHLLAVERCSPCHAVDRTGDSPNPVAPPFRTLHQLYPVEYLEEALAEGIFVGHTAMPQFRFDPPEIGAIIDYLNSLAS
jgi:mono/diheme cytochrome c family protein